VQHILDKVVTLRKKYGTTNPFEIAGSMNVNILFHDLGSLKGYYTYIRRSNYIVINSKLDEKMKHVICSHELAIICLHKEFAKYTPLAGYSSLT
jgi:Zn-dependent peptidase ImmA (M78 family)